MLETVRVYAKRTDKVYLLLCLFSSAMAVLMLASWAAEQGGGFAVDEITGQITGIGDYRRALVQAGASGAGVLIALLLSTVDYRSLVKVWPFHVAFTWGLVLPTLFIHNLSLGPLTIVVIVAIGSADLLFAVDSIPAIFGITQDAYLVFTANAFSLLGLRQLYFLIAGLLERLIYLGQGLAVILGFIGVKLVFHAMHVNELPFINGGEHIEWAPEIQIWFSLSFIALTIAVATAASLVVSKKRQERGLTPTGQPKEAVEADAK